MSVLFFMAPEFVCFFFFVTFDSKKQMEERRHSEKGLTVLLRTDQV